MGRQTSSPYTLPVIFYGLADWVRDGLDMGNLPMILQEAFMEAVHVELVSAGKSSLLELHPGVFGST